MVELRAGTQWNVASERWTLAVERPSSPSLNWALKALTYDTHAINNLGGVSGSACWLYGAEVLRLTATLHTWIFLYYILSHIYTVHLHIRTPCSVLSVLLVWFEPRRSCASIPYSESENGYWMHAMHPYQPPPLGQFRNTFDGFQIDFYSMWKWIHCD